LVILGIINQQTKTELLDTNQTYTLFDNYIDRILSNTETLKEEYESSDAAKSKILGEYHGIFDYKIRQVYDTLMGIHDLIQNTSNQYYRKYHGPYRHEIGEGLFDEIRRNVTYDFESYLAQLKTLLDLTVKFAYEICFTSNAPMRIDSLGKFFTRVYDKKNSPGIRNNWRIMKRTMFFSEIVKERNQLYEMENYRNHIIHQGYLDLQISHIPEQKEIMFDYKIPHVIWRNRKLVVSKTRYDNLTSFCREKYLLVLEILLNLTDKMYDPSIIKRNTKELLQFRKEDVAEIIKKLGRKGRWAEKWLKNESIAKEFLKDYNIDLDELVVENYEKHESELRKDDPDLVNYDERITYKPIKGIQVYKTKHVIGRGKDIKTFGWDFHVLKVEAVEEEYSKIPYAAKILECLRKCNLISLISKNPNSYGSFNEDLKKYLAALENANFVKWSQVQYHSFEYVREPYLDEKQELAKHHKNKEDFEKHLEEITKKRKEAKEEYKEWLKDPYEKRPLRFTYKNKKPLGSISKEDFLKEKKQKFNNWKQNKITITKPNGKKIIRKLVDKKPEDFIEECKKHWNKKSYNFYEGMRKMPISGRKSYRKKILKIKKEYKNTIKKYAALKPILKLINYDIYEKIDFKIVNSKNWIPEDSWILKEYRK